MLIVMNDPVAYFFFLCSIYDRPFLLLLPPRRNSDPKSHNRLFCHIPATVVGLHFYREQVQPFLPSSTCV